ncbi:MAG: hypothetical protein AB1714_06015 [Acidobacteriota bacterium]
MSRMLACRGFAWAGLGMGSTLLRAAAENLLAIVLLLFLFSFGLVDPSRMPRWLPDRCDERHPWAQPRMEDAAAMMRQVAGDRAAARARARAWVPALQREFSSRAVAERLRRVLSDG